MLDSIMNLVVGDREAKRAYRKMMKRVNALRKDYRYAFRKIQHYMFCVGPLDGDTKIFTDLLDLFETSAAEGREVVDVLGSDIANFCDEFMHSSISIIETRREKLNRESLKRLHNKEL